MKRTLFGMVLLGVLISNAAHAIVITAPTGLAPGTQYRLAFVTSTTRNATSTNIADYNAFVTGVANTIPQLAALGTTWTAIGSTATVDARDNTGTNPSSTGVPIYLLNNTKLADNNADLWDGTIDTAFSVLQNGNQIAPIFVVYTGSNTDGTGFAGRQLGSPSAEYGNVGDVGNLWITDNLQPNTALTPMFAISGVLTAPVPLPAAAWLFGSALGVMGVMRRKITG